VPQYQDLYGLLRNCRDRDPGVLPCPRSVEVDYRRPLIWAKNWFLLRGGTLAVADLADVIGQAACCCTGARSSPGR
jgi:hypothetical protein